VWQGNQHQTREQPVQEAAAWLGVQPQRRDAGPARVHSPCMAAGEGVAALATSPSSGPWGNLCEWGRQVGMQGGVSGDAWGRRRLEGETVELGIDGG
jgi:hypothetical protein